MYVDIYLCMYMYIYIYIYTYICMTCVHVCRHNYVDLYATYVLYTHTSLIYYINIDLYAFVKPLEKQGISV